MIEWIARNDRISRSKRLNTRFYAHVRAKHDLHDIVQKFDRVEPFHRRNPTHSDLGINAITINEMGNLKNSYRTK